MSLLNALRRIKRKEDVERILSSHTAEEIAEMITAANDAYYNKARPLLSDDTYDEAREHLMRRAPSHPVLASVGAPVGQGHKVALPHFMGSMNKLKTDREVTRWLDGGFKHGRFVVSDKLDGVSGMLVIDESSPKLFTRGDGVHGQDVSHLVPHVHGLRVRSNAPFVARGEFIMRKTDFAAASGKKSARNTVAGLVNAKRPNPALLRKVRFVAYEVIVPAGLRPSEQMRLAQDAGMEAVHWVSVGRDAINAADLARMLGDRKRASPYECDGIIVAHDEAHPRVAGSNPRHAFAFKSMELMGRAEVNVRRVEWAASKDGYLKPVVTFDPVELSGVTVGRATGHNAKFILDNGIGKGARITITRSGDVIPHIVGVVRGAPGGGGMPSPGVHGRYEWTSTGVDIVVADARGNRDVMLKGVEYFFSKTGVKGMGAAMAKRLFEAGLDTVGKVAGARAEDLVKIPGIGIATARSLVDSISSRLSRVDCGLMMAASNAFGRSVGEGTLREVTERFPRAVRGEVPSLEELMRVKGVARKTAEQVMRGIVAWKAFADANGLAGVCVPLEGRRAAPQNPRLAGKSFVFTGFRDEGMAAAIRDGGGEVKASVTRGVDFLLYKDRAKSSAKLDKASQLGIELVQVSEFPGRFLKED